METTWKNMKQTILEDTAILTGVSKDGSGVWTLISTMHGEDVLVKPSGVHVDVDPGLLSGHSALNDLAISMIFEWENYHSH